MNIGFSASRNGMTVAQGHRLRPMMLAGSIFHHGDCAGGDAQADAIAAELGIVRAAHPAIVAPRWRAYCNTEYRYTPEHPLVRNQIIVQVTRVLIACPSQMVAQPRGGTWYTIRFAHSIGARYIVIYPDGSMTENSFNAA